MYVKLQFREYLQVKSLEKSKLVSAYGMIEFLLANRAEELNLRGMPLVCK
jgi:hypothetical protein